VSFILSDQYIDTRRNSPNNGIWCPKIPEKELQLHSIWHVRWQNLLLSLGGTLHRSWCINHINNT